MTENLHKYLGSSVKIIPSKTLLNGKKIKGSVQIDYYDNDELDRMLQIVATKGKGYKLSATIHNE